MKDLETKEIAFRELYSRFSGRVFAYCKRMISDTGAQEDIFQEVFISLLRAAEQDKDIQCVLAFLLGATKNLSINHYRNQKQFIDISSIDIIDSTNTDNLELSEMMGKAIELLPEHYREAIVLHNYMGFSYEEIANIRNISLQDVKNHISRGKQKLRSILKLYFEYK